MKSLEEIKKRKDYWVGHLKEINSLLETPNIANEGENILIRQRLRVEELISEFNWILNT